MGCGIHGFRAGFDVFAKSGFDDNDKPFSMKLINANIIQKQEESHEKEHFASVLVGSAIGPWGL